MFIWLLCYSFMVLMIMYKQLNVFNVKKIFICCFICRHTVILSMFDWSKTANQVKRADWPTSNTKELTMRPSLWKTVMRVSCRSSPQIIGVQIGYQLFNKLTGKIVENTFRISTEYNFNYAIVSNDVKYHLLFGQISMQLSAHL